MQRKYGSHWWAVFFILFVLAAATGCAQLDYRIYQTPLHNLPVYTEIAEVPFYPQKSHQCGPAALATVLSWLGSEVTTEEITAEIYTPGRKGSLQPLLISATRYYGRLPYVIRDFEPLMQEVAAGHPVVVLQNLGLTWYPLWHYAVVIGYDTEKQIVILRSGEVFRKESSWSLFHRTWGRAGKWGLVALPLTELPISADEESYLAAVVALENVNNWDAASIAYETALKRWPKSLVALMGLGNSRYAMGNLEEAEEAFRRVVDLCQTCGDAFNNLAHVLAKQRCYDAAMDAAREAVHLGGPNASIYHETLEEITRLKERGG
jgi:tetratricopeptide (TPR) repeat protein